MTTCPFFGKCGGCKYNFASPDYHVEKLAELPRFDDLGNVVAQPVWTHGPRRRADFSVIGGRFGFFARGSNDIVSVRNCPLIDDEINGVLTSIANMPWIGNASVLITHCANGITVDITSDLAQYSGDFLHSIQNMPREIIRVSWNGLPRLQRAQPTIIFENHTVNFPLNAFLQPSLAGEDALRTLVTDAITGEDSIADLFCGLGTFALPIGAVGYDIATQLNRRDLMKNPLRPRELLRFNAVILDPPRAGAAPQIRELSRANERPTKIIYVSCNPKTFLRDADTLTRGGWRGTRITPVDQFVGTAHWELVGVFER